MTNEFKKISQGDVTRYVLENASSGGTSAGSVASVSMPIGGMQRRKGDNLIAQEADKNTVPASTPRNFVAKNAKTAGAGAHKDKSKTIPRKEKHKKPFMEDHSTATGGWGQGSYDTYTAGNHGRGVAENPEWYSDEANSMSSSQLKSLYKHAMKLRQAVKQMQQQGDTLEPWQQSKVTKAADYLDAVFNAVDDEHDMGEEQGVAEGEGGLNQTAGIGINGKQFNFSIKDLIAKAQNYPVKKLNPQLFVKQLADRHEDPKQTASRAQAADLQYPIIVVQDGNTLMIADGTHRAQKAIMNKLPSINAHVIPVKDMAEFSKQGVA